MNFERTQSRRAFIRNMGTVLGVSVVGGAALAACGDNPTATTAPATVAPTATPAPTTAVPVPPTTAAQATSAATAQSGKTDAPATSASSGGSIKNGTDVGAASDFANITEPKQIKIASKPAYVTVADGKISVLSAVCTHQGCTVEWDGVNKQYECPCHGSVFDAQGFNVSGPARKPLALFTSQVVNGRLIVSPKA